MADLLAVDGWARAGSVGPYLREALPDDYSVVADARLCGRQFAAAIVGRTALFVVDDLDAESGAGKGPKARESAERFLKDEFPELSLLVVAMSVARDWAEEEATWRVVEPPEARDQPLAQAIIASDYGDFHLPDAETREVLATALRDRQLTASQVASKPFFFRSGSKLRTGSRVQTVREAVEHMDRNPVDGMQVLRDGTLADWLQEEGALHLAALAAEVVRQPRVDTRASLERFLQGAGLVTPPQLVATPAAVDLGYVVQGQQAKGRLRMDRQGRGYLFGEVSGADHWLGVEPRSFAGAPAELVVTAQTDGLQIDPLPYETAVVIKSSAGAEPVRVPVSLRVVAEPAGAIQSGVRPLAGLLVGACIGALLGWLWRVTGLVESSRTVLWIVALALIWGVAGVARGRRQPPAWPLRYSLARWLPKLAAWSVGLGVLAALIVEAWRLGLGGGLQIEGLTLAKAFVIGAAIGFAPATLDEMVHSRHARDQEYVHGRQSSRRPILIAAGLVGLLLIALLAPRAVTPLLNESGVQAGLQTGRSWTLQQLDEFGNRMNGLIDRATVRYYNKPAGVIGGTPTPEGPGLELPNVLGAD